MKSVVFTTQRIRSAFIQNVVQDLQIVVAASVVIPIPIYVVEISVMRKIVIPVVD
jgi:hypothetical protein